MKRPVFVLTTRDSLEPLSNEDGLKIECIIEASYTFDPVGLPLALRNCGGGLLVEM